MRIFSSAPEVLKLRGDIESGKLDSEYTYCEDAFFAENQYGHTPIEVAFIFRSIEKNDDGSYRVSDDALAVLLMVAYLYQAQNFYKGDQKRFSVERQEKISIAKAICEALPPILDVDGRDRFDAYINVREKISRRFEMEYGQLEEFYREKARLHRM